jgi:hypothetical protein
MVKKLYLALLCLIGLTLILSGCGIPQEEYNALSTDLSSAQNEISNLQGELVSSQKEVEGLQNELTTQFEELDQLRSANVSLQEELIELGNKLDIIFDTTVTQYYHFAYKQSDYYWTLPIPLRIYFFYDDKPRPDSFSGYSSMAADPYDDTLMENMVSNLDEAAATRKLSKLEKANFVITFIQSLPYTEDIVTTPYDEYPRYPVETLFDRGGDCEDTSILTGALFTEMGYDVALLIFEEQQHMAVGVDMLGASGYYWEYQGKKYFYLETTGDGWEIGDCPPEFRNALADVYPVDS